MAALPQARRWLALDPLHEPAHRRLMALLAASGDQVSALRQYESCVQLLGDELQIEPAAETQALYEEIRAGRYAWGEELPGKRAAAVYGRTAPDLPRHNLPQSFTPFVGRHLELKELTQLLCQSEQRLITLTGPGGMGKTRLALQAAWQMLREQPGRWPHGVWQVGLAAVEQSEQVAVAIAEALPLLLRGNAPAGEQLRDYVIGRHMLLVLDNFEQIVSGQNGQAALALLTDLLQQAPGLSLLVTSRERLNLHGELVFQLAGLPFPEMMAVAPENYDAVQLFVLSAQRAQRAFGLDESNRKEVVRVCQLLQGLPLALTMAGAWVRLLSCADIAAEVAQGLDFLESHAPNLPARHHSMRAVFDHSWRLLTAEEQRIYRQLAVFRGGFTREGAITVTGASLPILGTFVDKSLLQRDVSGRFVRHPLLWQFSLEKLQADAAEWQETWAAHARYCADFVAERTARLRSAEQVIMWREMEAEIDNLRGGWQFALETEAYAILQKMAKGLFRFFSDRGRFLEGLAFFGRSLERLTAAAPHSLYLYLQTYYAAMQVRIGHYEAAASQLQVVIEAATPLGLTECVVLARRTLGVLEDLRGNYEVAMGYLQAARHQIEALGDNPALQSELSAVINSMGIVVWREGDYDGAEAYIGYSYQLAQAYGAPYDIALRLGNLANIAFVRKEYEKSLQMFRDAYDCFEAIDSLWGMGVISQNLSDCYAALGDYEQVVATHERGLHLKEEVGDYRGAVQSLQAMGENYLKMGKLAEAERTLRQGLRQAQLAVNVAGAVVPLVGTLGKVLWQQGQVARGVELMAFACAQPALYGAVRDDLTAVLTQLAAELPPGQMAAAQEQGRQRELADLVQELLAAG
jgi:predicted ATPase